MKGTDWRRIATLALAQLFVAPLAPAAETEKPQTRDARAPAKTGAAKANRKQATQNRDAAEKHYRKARALESKGDERGALAAYLAAGEAGHGLAQKRLGEIYDKGNSAARRDYDTALRWYEKARAQGIEIPKPFIRGTR
jgi:TPR repeat protein